MVLWIGYLQWHYRTRGNVNPPLPVLKDFHNIECRDAVLAYDRIEFEADADGKPVMRWDGKTTKRHPVTGLDVPDEVAQVSVEKYVNARAAQWPAADFVIGNPPFIGNKVMRTALGDGYVDALRAAWPKVPPSADLVMYWWEQAAELVSRGKVRRFGLITTNGLRQTFNRRVIERHLGNRALSICFAVPDHPWIDGADGAAVRISMTVGSAEAVADSGQLMSVKEGNGTAQEDGGVALSFDRRIGSIQADLSIGPDLLSARALKSNLGLAGQGIKIVGDGFFVEDDHGDSPLNPSTRLPVVRKLIGPRDLLTGSKGRLVIDYFGLSEPQARTTCGWAYQQLLTSVKPTRDMNARQSIRELWWKFGWDRPTLRAAFAGLRRYFATLETSKHRFFCSVDVDALPDGSLFAIACEDGFVYGVLSSRIHVAWALANGGRLGVGNDPRYTKTRCFETYPFPSCTETQRAAIATFAEEINAHRKLQQAQHPDLSLTNIYNVLEKLRSGEPLNAVDKATHNDGLVSVLGELHDSLDRAVFDAYGWNDLAAELIGKPGATTPRRERPTAQAAAEEELLSRLVQLNAARAAEEARGMVRWIRPEFQAHQSVGQQTEIEEDGPSAVSEVPTDKRTTWPNTLPEQIRLVADAVASSRSPLDLDQLAARFKGRGPWKKRLPDIVESLSAIGRIRAETRDGRLMLHI
jgi:hypothetical protein